MDNENNQQSVDACREDWKIVCGHWKDELVAIHDKQGLLVSGLTMAQAKMLTDNHNRRPAEAKQSEEVALPEEHGFTVIGHRRVSTYTEDQVRKITTPLQAELAKVRETAETDYGLLKYDYRQLLMDNEKLRQQIKEAKL